MDVKNLDLLSPAARRDLEALQSSGLESIHYPGFLAEVSSGHLRPDLGRSEEVGVGYCLTSSGLSILP